MHLHFPTVSVTSAITATNTHHGAGEGAQRLRALAVLAEDPSSVSSSHDGWLCNSSFNCELDTAQSHLKEVSCEGLPRSRGPGGIGGPSLLWEVPFPKQMVLDYIRELFLVQEGEPASSIPMWFQLQVPARFLSKIGYGRKMK